LDSLTGQGDEEAAGGQYTCNLQPTADFILHPSAFILACDLVCTVEQGAI